jgi:hypothetical protein
MSAVHFVFDPKLTVDPEVANVINPRILVVTGVSEEVAVIGPPPTAVDLKSIRITMRRVFGTKEQTHRRACGQVTYP